MVEEDPAEIVADAGTVAAVELSDRLTTAPPDGAAPESVSVQMLDAPPITIPGAHWRDESVTVDAAVTVRSPVRAVPL